MARALLVGCTNYSIQSMDDMENDILEWLDNLQNTKNIFDEKTCQLKQTGYWPKVDIDFQLLSSESYKLFDTAIKDLQLVLNAINTGIESYHVNLLENLGRSGNELNKTFGQVWHQHYNNKEYGNKDFKLVEDIYINGRNMAADMKDLSNLATRMKDFIGNGVNKNMSSKIINNTFNGTVSNLQQNYGHSVGIQRIISESKNELNDVINQIKDIMKLLPEIEKQDLNEYVNDLDEASKEDSPKKSKIKSFSTSIISILSKILNIKNIKNADELFTRIPKIIENINKVIG